MAKTDIKNKVTNFRVIEKQKQKRKGRESWKRKEPKEKEKREREKWRICTTDQQAL